MMGDSRLINLNQPGGVMDVFKPPYPFWSCVAINFVTELQIGGFSVAVTNRSRKDG